MDLSGAPLPPLPMPPRKRRPETLTTQNRVPDFRSGPGLPNLSAGGLSCQLPPLRPLPGLPGSVRPGAGPGAFQPLLGTIRGSHSARPRRGSNASMSGRPTFGSSAGYGYGSSASPFDSVGYGTLPPLSNPPYASGPVFGTSGEGNQGRRRKMSGSNGSFGLPPSGFGDSVRHHILSWLQVLTNTLSGIPPGQQTQLPSLLKAASQGPRQALLWKRGRQTNGLVPTLAMYKDNSRGSLHVN